MSDVVAAVCSPRRGGLRADRPGRVRVEATAMTTVVWFAVEAALVVAVVLAWPRRVRHYRWRNRRFLRRVHAIELRSRGDGSEEADRRPPEGLSALAGVERADSHPADAPPAPMPLADAACPSAAVSVRPQCVRLGGAR